VIALFMVLACGPLLLIGFLGYGRARRAMESVISAQTDTLVRRAATVIRDRYARIESDALLAGDNAEAHRLTTALASGDSSRIRVARADADSFLRAVWMEKRDAYRSIELRDERGAVLLTAGEPNRPRDSDTLRSPSVRSGAAGMAEPRQTVSVPVPAGRIVLDLAAETLIPAAFAAPNFGRSGYLLVVDRDANRVAWDSRSLDVGRSVRDVTGLDAMGELRNSPSGVLRYVEHDSARIASYVSLPAPALSILSATATSEFLTGLADVRLINFGLAAAIAVAVAVASTLLVGRTTRSLEELTAAVSAVGHGDMSPRLPVGGDGEVAALSATFAYMLERMRTTMREIEISRQLAVVGEFSAQLAHEIRNPLTSLKLNLQGMLRDVQQGRMPATAETPLQICAREVGRLDTVVRGVLALARQPDRPRESVSLDATLARVLELLEPQLAAGRIAVERVTDNAGVVDGDAEQLTGLFMNLVLNAVEAQPDGGRILIASEIVPTEATRYWRIVVADDGPGMLPEVAARAFHPFVTTKATGTGLGLAMAVTAARAHGGHIDLVAAVPGYRGAAFAVTLPISSVAAK
jgi:signal transduction histidine kinase